MKKVYLTEEQFNYILQQQMLNEGVLRNLWQRLFGSCNSEYDIVKRIIALVAAGFITFGIAINLINNSRGTILTNEQATEIIDTISQQIPKEEWVQMEK